MLIVDNPVVSTLADAGVLTTTDDTKLDTSGVEPNFVLGMRPRTKSIFNWKISSLENTDITFEPRFEIEFAKAGEYGERTAFSSTRRSGLASPTRTRARQQVRHRVRYAFCQERWRRSGLVRSTISSIVSLIFRTSR